MGDTVRESDDCCEDKPVMISSIIISDVINSAVIIYTVLIADVINSTVIISAVITADVINSADTTSDEQL